MRACIGFCVYESGSFWQFDFDMHKIAITTTKNNNILTSKPMFLFNKSVKLSLLFFSFLVFNCLCVISQSYSIFFFFFMIYFNTTNSSTSSNSPNAYLKQFELRLDYVVTIISVDSPKSQTK